MTAIEAQRGLVTGRRAPVWLGGAATSVVVGAVAGLASSAVMPRGPLTSVQALSVIAGSLGVGVIAGAVMRSRWAWLWASAAYVAAIEVGRIGLDGASIEQPRFDTVYGIAAFVVGRGLHAVLALLPVAVGVGIGIAHAGRRRPGPWTVVGGLLTVALAVLVAWPASSPPVMGANGEPIPGSIAEITKVDLDGSEQAISVRAADPTDPVLLYLSGGPGQSDLGYGRVLLEPLVDDFVVVIWDQRGNGLSYPAIDPTASVTLDRAVSDTVAMADYLRGRFDEERIYLLGESWGSTLGVLAVQERPDLFHAYVGSGQMVSQRQTDRIIWRDLLAHAEAIGDWVLYDEVLGLGEPPYDDMPWSNSRVMGWYGLITEPYTPPAAYLERGASSGLGPLGIMASEYSVMDKANVLRGLVDSFDLMYPQLQQIDFRTDVPALDVPVYILDGGHELSARRDLAREWFAMLEAPVKEMITYPDAGHAVVFEHVDDFRTLMLEEIVPATYRE